MADSSSEVEETRSQSQYSGIRPVTPAVTLNGYEFSKTLLEKVSDECLTIVKEELEDFMQRTRDRLNLVKPGLSVDELSKEVCRLVSFYFGNPSARIMTGTKRAPNEWNKFIHENFSKAKAELGTYFPFIYLFAHNSRLKLSSRNANIEIKCH